MMDELPAVTRPNGKQYRPRKVVAWRWENDDASPVLEGCGAVVLGTHDPEVNWFRLGYQGGELAWVRDAVKGRAGVMFTADYPEV
jgi:hypothetical protein